MTKMGKNDNNKKKDYHDSFTWQTRQDSNTDPTKGPTSTTITENQVLSDGTRIIKTVQTLKQTHEHGATTVKNTNMQRIEVVTEEERIVGEEITFWDCFLFCCPCFKKKKVEEDNAEEGGGDGGSNNKWKPVPKD
mmetsp:Transcript_12853/g.23166  ORF Transcript_12853/g.23166 Transcript_12853/m.23166 type:complete len:135 (+) Transcript_12853:189-593(+)